ncbi:Zinc finger BED domain-containing protein 4 [Eumeta japonica]|uniref:Zinc finger BED domain-containing protein 4 n=1 Tax=Eumeta variegata TaxID=151549 RepID=A0A4C1SC88_EUMVA|nr:Zinc finger BED domain-containing protein 4 [Eumeta japonica]
MAPGKKSEIWRYFTPFDKDRAKCNICEKVYSRAGRTTSGLRTHLKAVHAEEFELLIRAETELQASKMLISPETPLKEVKKQLSIEESIMKKKQWDAKHPLSQQIDYRISEMIALDSLPFNFVENVGFRRLMQLVAPQYTLKGRNFFTEHSQELYAKVANKVKFILSDLKFMSFTTDIWSEPAANVSLLSLTCHGITANFNRLRIILKCEEFHERHTGDVIASKFESMLNEWNILKEQVHCMVRDEGSNMKRAMSLAG